MSNPAWTPYRFYTPTIKVSLTFYEWHTLLKELENNFSDVGRDKNNSKQLYEKILSQLDGTKMVIKK